MDILHIFCKNAWLVIVDVVYLHKVVNTDDTSKLSVPGLVDRTLLYIIALRPDATELSYI